MTPEFKKIVWQLLEGNCIKQRNPSDPKRAFVLCDFLGNPISYVHYRTFKKLKGLLKQDKHKRYTLNLKLVRQLHGKNFIKRE
jgi:hypothetical protein